MSLWRTCLKIISTWIFLTISSCMIMLLTKCDCSMNVIIVLWWRWDAQEMEWEHQQPNNKGQKKLKGSLTETRGRSKFKGEEEGFSQGEEEGAMPSNTYLKAGAKKGAFYLFLFYSFIGWIPMAVLFRENNSISVIIFIPASVHLILYYFATNNSFQYFQQ